MTITYGAKQDLLTRDEVVKIVGEKLVEKVESENCDYTNRAIPEGLDLVEFSASIELSDNDNYRILTAYYYQSQSDLDNLTDDQGLDILNWEIAGYELI